MDLSSIGFTFLRTIDNQIAFLKRNTIVPYFSHLVQTINSLETKSGPNPASEADVNLVPYVGGMFSVRHAHLQPTLNSLSYGADACSNCCVFFLCLNANSNFFKYCLNAIPPTRTNVKYPAASSL